MPVPFVPQFIPMGVGGLNLRLEPAKVQPPDFVNLSNVTRANDGGWTSRPGLTDLANVAAVPDAHSVRRLYNPVDAVATYIWGVGTKLYYGVSGALAEADTGYSGSPLSLLPYRPSLSGEPWMIVADGGTGGKMRKIKADGTDLALGLTFPSSALVTGIASELQTSIDKFESSGGWNENEVDAAESTVVAAATDTDAKQGSTSVVFEAAVDGGTGTKAFTCFWNKTLDLDFTKVGQSAAVEQDATDDDHFHFWMKVDLPQYCQEVRIYFVVSADFQTDTIPGIHATKNTDAFMRVFRPAAITGLVELTSFARETAEDVVDQGQVDEAAEEDEDTGAELVAGRGTWTEFGTTGVPLRRGTFMRIGADKDRGWDTVTGIVVLVRTNAAQTVKVYLDDLYFQGGYGPDSTEVGATSYDHRYIHYDPRTGAKSNPSAIQDEDDWLDPVRQAIRCFPDAYGDSAIRQRFYRRGGSLQANWYLVGQNDSDGGCGTDIYNDQTIVLSATLQTDNDVPVTTEDENGDAVYEQPLRSIWGPVSHVVMGCGDPYRAGFLYWCKAGEIDSWPSANWREVCSSGEELMAGGVYGAQAFVFSRERLYMCYPKITGATDVVVTPSQCQRGLVARWGMAVGPFGIFFIARDGIYRTLGGPEENITDSKIKPIFESGTSEYAPVDFGVQEALRLVLYNNELWFQYQDTGGIVRHMIYDMIFKFWRSYSFTGAGRALYDDEGASPPRLIIGSAGGNFRTHEGNSDDGVAIAAAIWTGHLDQGFPRNQKIYGDFMVDADRDGETITPAFFYNYAASSLGAVQTIAAGAARDQYVTDLGTTDAQLATNCQLRLAWSSTSSRPIAYAISLSHIPQPEQVDTRAPYDWDHAGVLADKWVKGVEIECNTYNAAKAVQIQVDGADQQLISVTANGRQVLHFAWTQFRGRLLRVRPTENTVPWLLYNVRWIFDEEPLLLTRWETQYTDHGLPGYHSLYHGFFSLESNGIVTITLTYLQQDGTSNTITKTIPSTGGVKQKRFVSFDAAKGVLFKYAFTAAAGFYLYKEESHVMVLPWAGQEIPVNPFGTDNLDGIRGIRDAAASAIRSGGGNA